MAIRKGHKTEYAGWTGEDVAVLMEFYSNTKTIELVPLLNRSKQSIDHKARRLGLKKSDELLYQNKSERRGELSPTWKGGKTRSSKGYVVIRNDGSPMFEHRAIMEAHIGRKLSDNEVVHHINGDKTDNRLENLELMTAGEHSALHNRRRAKCSIK